MQKPHPQYVEGWTAMATAFQNLLSQSIEKHNGGKQAHDILAILNDLIEYSHRLNFIVFEYESMLEEGLVDGEDLPEFAERALYLAVDNTKEE